MCGIVGIISKSGLTKDQTDLFRDMLVAGQLRGDDSTGIMYGNKDEVHVLKSAVDSTAFVYKNSYAEVVKERHKWTFMIGHNRAATRGAVSDMNAHPFQEGHITLVHNGTLHSWIPKEFQVDSHYLTRLVADKGVKYGLEDVSGAYACAIHDKNDKTITLVRNKERPLSILNTGSTIYFASESGMLAWLLNRKKIDSKNIGILTPLSALKISIETLSEGSYDIQDTFCDYGNIWPQEQWKGRQVVTEIKPTATTQTAERRLAILYSFRPYNPANNKAHPQHRYGEVRGILATNYLQATDQDICLSGITEQTWNMWVSNTVGTNPIGSLSLTGSTFQDKQTTVRQARGFEQRPYIKPKFDRETWLVTTEGGCHYCSADVLEQHKDSILFVGHHEALCHVCSDTIVAMFKEAV